MNSADLRFANQGQILVNISDNVGSGKYAFSGGKRQFIEWKTRAMASVNNGERQALLIEADRFMHETKAAAREEYAAVKKKWKFW
jgi:hypothetical protein